MIVGEVISVENKSIVHVIRRTGKLKVDSHEKVVFDILLKETAGNKSKVSSVAGFTGRLPEPEMRNPV